MTMAARTVKNGTGAGTDYTVLVDNLTVDSQTGDVQLISGIESFDDPVVGRPMMVGAWARDDADPTAVSADGDITYITTDRKGRIHVRPIQYTTTIRGNSSALTTATTAYTAGDQLGDVITLASAARISGGNGIIRGFTLLDKADITGVVDLMVFRSAVSEAADNAAATFSDTDMEAWIGTANMNMVDYGANRGGVVSCFMPFDCSAAALSIYLVTRSGHTFFGAATDLRVTAFIQQD